MQHALVASGIPHGIGGIDDEVLQNQPQHGARHLHGAHFAQRLVGVHHQPLAAGIGHDFQCLRDEVRKAHRLDHMRVAGRAHEFAQRRLHDGGLALHHLDVGCARP